MGWKQWTGVAALIGGGILLQIPGRDDTEMDHAAMRQSEMLADVAEPRSPFTTVALDVTGMT